LLVGLDQHKTHNHIFVFVFFYFFLFKSMLPKKWCEE
jgi:hypothetical protein